MMTFSEQLNEYRRQLQKGAIQQAYKGLLEYVMVDGLKGCVYLNSVP